MKHLAHYTNSMGFKKAKFDIVFGFFKWQFSQTLPDCLSLLYFSPTHSPLILEPSRITPHLPGARPHTLFEQAI